MLKNTQTGFFRRLLVALLLGAFLFSACNPTISATTLPTSTATTAPTETSAPTATAEPTATAVPATVGNPQFSLDAGGLFSSFQTETVPAVSASENAPYWEVLPEYTRVTLQGYPIADRPMQPQIFIYPLSDLGKVNEGAGKVVASMQMLIQSPQEIPNMPFMPLTGDVQMMHTHLQYLDFKNGQGLRYLTQYGNGISLINNSGLVYTYQGITSDGKYYVAAVLPVHHPSLPDDATITGKEPPEFTSDYPGYRASVAQALNVQAPNTFSPDLTLLDAMMSSLEIK